jgi:GH15 family glucan-1,4-alpha-glucosidase
VVSALQSASRFAKLLGKEVAQKRWASVAEDMQKSIIATLLDGEGRVAKRLEYTKDGTVLDFTHDIASFYGLFRYGILESTDPILEKLSAGVCEKLVKGLDVCGVIRYEGDAYFAHGGPSNPWIVTTCWLTEYEIARAKTLDDLELPQKRLQWICARANSAGLFAEQYHPYTLQPMSVTPLMWSHAQYVLTFLTYVKKLHVLQGEDAKQSRTGS